jgi:hypothetical protein
MRFHAVVIASAHGQVAWIFRRRRRPLHASRAAACRTRDAASWARLWPVGLDYWILAWTDFTAGIIAE